MPKLNLPLLKNASLKGKRVLVRVDFNVPIKNSRVLDDFRIRKTLPTIKWILNKGGEPVLITHMDPVISTKPVSRHLDKLLKRKITMQENLRFDKREVLNSASYARELAMLGDIYVNDAFGASHRKHASIVGLPKYLPSYMGLLMAEEIRALSETLLPMRPFLFILGGLKFKTKIRVLDRLLKKADKIFIAGAIANTFLSAKGYSVGKSIYEKKYAPRVKKYYINKRKIILPTDVIIGGGRNIPVSEVKSKDRIYDAGTETLKLMKEYIAESKMILWNGPLGALEENYDEGTRELIKLLSASKAKVIIGGGDTHILIKKMKKENSFYHLSTGGGAMLDFLSDGSLYGIEALIKSKK